ncbi:MAG: DUF5716 family protein [Lachnospiraceae bacterium]|nr:DUF5716 family protein [Robinsoniella sp.]MDY3767568.1 DUF5716 family protein [Lachnospiraceae bacterium]
MKNLFQVLPEDFFKPLTGKYRREYADCILLLFRSFKTEISYGVNRETVVKTLEGYFETDDLEMTFDDQTYIKDAREKANGVIAYLKACGWLEYEQEKNHQLNVVLYEYAVPIIESMNKIIREEEAEYQGIISQIHASLQNKDLYAKPYELIIKGVQENTERLISELKKLNASIKRHMDRQTNEMSASEIIDHFFEYHKNIGSKAYLRMKTSENISYFRSSIIEKIEEILESTAIMERAIAGYMEVEQEESRDKAYDNLVAILLDVKSMFYRLDEIIEEIDRKHTQYMKNAVMRARFKLATGNNMEGKLLRILDQMAEDLNQEEQNLDETETKFAELCSIYSQGYVSPESLRTIPVIKKNAVVDNLSGEITMTQEERELYKEALRMKNRTRFSRKNINEYVKMLLRGKEKISVEEIPVESKRDLIRIIYISIYAGNKANNYEIRRTGKRVKRMGFEFPLFEIIKR